MIELSHVINKYVMLFNNNNKMMNNELHINGKLCSNKVNAIKLINSF